MGGWVGGRDREREVGEMVGGRERGREREVGEMVGGREKKDIQ